MSDHRKITLALLREHGEFIKASTHGEKWRVPVTGGVIMTVPADGRTPKGSDRWKYAAEEIQRVLRRYRLSYEQLEENLARIDATPDPAEAMPAVTTPTRAPLPAWGPPGWHDDRAKREKETVDVRATTEDTSDDETRATDNAGDGGGELQPDPAATPHEFVKSTVKSEGGHFLCTVCRQTTKHRAHTTWRARQAASPVAAVSDGEDVVLPCPHCSGSGSLTVPLADLREFLLKRGR